MRLLEKLKSVLGMGGQQSASAAEPDVTVEREPETGTERAVKGPGSGATAAEPAADRESPGTAASPPVSEIDGVGPTYAERLAEAGIETVADLAGSDVETVADATGAGPSRVEDWLAQARDR